MPTRPKNVREKYELRRITDDATIHQAFQLAHSIYCYREEDRKIALNILWEALRAVEVRLMAQDEADRHEPRKPTKVRWGAVQWLQFLIYHKSERYEREQEANHRAKLGKNDLLVRYMKHLLLITCRRNSFYVSLGLSRLLHNYSTAEAMAIYDLVFQDPDSSTKKADAYYRDRKNKLIEEIKKRFPQFLEIHQGARGENRFQTQDDSGSFTELVKRYLQRFTPWETSCEFPEHFDEWNPIHPLQSNQASQIHSLIHPTCFSRITTALKLDPPERRLAIPKFFLTKDDEAQSTPSIPSGDDPPPSALTEKEVTAIRDKLTEEEDRRQLFMPQSLAVIVDGVECARLDLTQPRQIHFEVEEDATLLEVVGYDKQGELLLATHMLTYEDSEAGEASPVYSIILKDGQKISITIRVTHSDADMAGAIIDIHYQEAHSAKAASPAPPFEQRLIQPRKAEGWWRIFGWSPKLAWSLVALILAAIILYVALKSRPAEPQQVAKEPPPPAIREEEKPNTKPEIIPPPSTNKEPSSGRSGVTKPPSNSAKPGTTTREPSNEGIKSLLDVQRVYVDSLGDDTFSREVRQRLIETLQNSSRFVIARGTEDADTALMGSARQEQVSRDDGTGREIVTGNISIELVNVSGGTIWPARKYRGTAEQVAKQYTKDLSEAIRRQARRREKNH